MKKLIKNIILIALIAAVAVFGYNKYKEHKMKGIYINGIEITSSDYNERLKNEASEVPGMTRYDKLQAGLSPYNADSDQDGLTDEEELNTYHSDPTKKSTADDFYTDKYKIDHDMDVNQKYEYDGDLTYEENECPEVILNADNIEDLSAVVRNLSIPDEDDITIYKKYRIYNYSGPIVINVSDILKEKNIGIDSIELYTIKAGSDKTSKMSVKVDNQKCNLVVKDRFNYDDINYIYVVDKNTNIKTSKIKKIISDLNTAIPFTSVATDSVDVKVLVSCKPFPGFLCNWIFKKQAFTEIYYVDSGITANNQAAIQRMINIINLMYSINPKSDNPFTVESSCVKCISKEEYDEKLARYETLDVNRNHRFKGDCINQPAEQFFTYCYFTYDDTLGYVYDYSKGKQELYQVDVEYIDNREPFNIEKDTFPFGNFGTKYSPGGVCMGVSTYITKIYNSRTFDLNGGYNIDGTDVKWDLSTDAIENMTLFNPVLNDYKTDTFVKDRTDKTGVLHPKTEAEEEFTTMISCRWKEGNDKIKSDCALLVNGKSNDSYAGLKKVLEYMDAGNVLTVGFVSEGKGGHAVVAYGYEMGEDGDIIFNIYDNNYPGRSDLVLKIYHKHMNYDWHDSFDYEYTTDAYTFSSLEDECHCISFLTGDFDILYPNWVIPNG